MVNLSKLLSLLLCLPILASATAADQTHGWRGDGHGVYADARPPLVWDLMNQRHVRWHAAIAAESVHGGTAAVGYSDPVVSGDRLYVTAEPDRVLCFRVSDGSRLWEVRTSAADDPAKAMTPGAHSRFGYATATPITDGQRLYCVFGFGLVICLDHDGKTVWRRRFAAPTGLMEGVSLSPSLAGKVLITGDAADAMLIAWQAQDGQQLWTLPRPADWQAGSFHGQARVAADGRSLILPGGASIDVQSGRVLKGKPGALPADRRPGITNGGTTWHLRGSVLHSQQKSLLVPAENWSAPVIAGKHLFLFGGGAYGSVLIHNLETGQTTQRRHDLFGRMVLGEAVPLCPWTPVFAADRMFLRDERGVWCIDRRLQGGSLDQDIAAIVASVPKDKRVRAAAHQKNKPAQHASVSKASSQLVKLPTARRDQVIIALSMIRARDDQAIKACLAFLDGSQGPYLRRLAEDIIRNAGAGMNASQVDKHFAALRAAAPKADHVSATVAWCIAASVHRKTFKQTVAKLDDGKHPDLRSALVRWLAQAAPIHEHDKRWKKQGTGLDKAASLAWLDYLAERFAVERYPKDKQRFGKYDMLRRWIGSKDKDIAVRALTLYAEVLGNDPRQRGDKSDKGHFMRHLRAVPAPANRYIVERLADSGSVKELVQIATGTFRPVTRYHAVRALQPFTHEATVRKALQALHSAETPVELAEAARRSLGSLVKK